MLRFNGAVSVEFGSEKNKKMTMRRVGKKSGKREKPPKKTFKRVEFASLTPLCRCFKLCFAHIPALREKRSEDENESERGRNDEENKGEKKGKHQNKNTTLNQILVGVAGGEDEKKKTLFI